MTCRVSILFASIVLFLMAPGIPALQSSPCDRRAFAWRTAHKTASVFGIVTVATSNTFTPASFPDSTALAFEGGVGGLGKTRPETGVVLREGSAPIQNKQGIVTAEILSGKNNPILIEFKTPWPLLQTTTGLEARDLQQGESAFLQVLSDAPIEAKSSSKILTKLLTDNILTSKGKYGT